MEEDECRNALEEWFYFAHVEREHRQARMAKERLLRHMQRDLGVPRRRRRWRKLGARLKDGLAYRWRRLRPAETRPQVLVHRAELQLL
jgi:hypothetical protein